MASRKIQSTKNYRLFTRSSENRHTDTARRKKLKESMRRYGFLPCFPIVCVRNDKGHLIIKDGQHRVEIAEELGLTVYWIEEATDFDIAIVNSASRPWNVKDYAQMNAANGKADYQQGLDFAEKHKIPIGTAFALLAGTTSFGNVRDAFEEGRYKVKDREWADSVACVYGPLVSMSPMVRNERLLQACMCVCRVEGFDTERMLHKAGMCREKLVAYSTREAYLTMLHDIYNFGPGKRFPLKFEAEEAMRKRNAAQAAPRKAANEKRRKARIEAETEAA